MLDRFVNETANAQSKRLTHFLHLLERIFDALPPAHDDSTVEHTLLLASLLRARQAGRSVQILAAEGFVEEILVIGRTLVEMTVNAVYLQYAGPRELQFYIEFQPGAQPRPSSALSPVRQGTFAKLIQRVVNRFTRATAPVTGIATGVANGIATGPATRNGARQTEDAPSWTRHSLLERAQLADLQSDTPMLASMVERCFPRAQDALHGTIGALDSFLDALDRGRANTRADRLPKLTEALFGINLSLLTLAVYLNREYGLGMDEALDHAANADSATAAAIDAPGPGEADSRFNPVANREYAHNVVNVLEASPPRASTSTRG